MRWIYGSWIQKVYCAKSNKQKGDQFEESSATEYLQHWQSSKESVYTLHAVQIITWLSWKECIFRIQKLRLPETKIILTEKWFCYHYFHVDKIGNIVILFCRRFRHHHQHPNYYCCHFMYVSTQTKVSCITFLFIPHAFFISSFLFFLHEHTFHLFFWIECLSLLWYIFL